MSKVLLVGSPNVGKSLIFNKMTGHTVSVSNYPGTTVEVAAGVCHLNGQVVEILDTPGLYSLYPLSEEENVTRRLLKHIRARWVVHVIDAKNLIRMLPLTLELIHLGFPVILAVNMIDEARRQHIAIDATELRKQLDIPVVLLSGLTGEGIPELERMIAAESPRLAASRRLPVGLDYQQLLAYHQEAQRIGKRVIRLPRPTNPYSRSDRFLLDVTSGLALGVFLLYVSLYLVVGRFGGGILVDLIDAFFSAQILPALAAIVQQLRSPLVESLLIGEFGLASLALRYAIAIILPVTGTFFLIFSIWEDSGYLPRLAYVLNRFLHSFGLNGRAIIPLVLGLACGTLAVLSTRTLESKRERLITTILLAVSVPCSAQLGLILGLLAEHPAALAVWLISVILAFLWTGSLLGLITPGHTPAFLQEIPPLRWPSLNNCLLKTGQRLIWYLREILPLFLLTSVVLWIGQVTGILTHILHALERATHLLSLPPEAARILLFGFFRRDYGAAGLYDFADSLNWQQLSIISVTLTLFVPCAAQFLVIVKERGPKIALLILALTIAVAFSAGLLLRLLLVG